MIFIALSFSLAVSVTMCQFIEERKEEVVKIRKETREEKDLLPHEESIERKSKCCFRQDVLLVHDSLIDVYFLPERKKTQLNFTTCLHVNAHFCDISQKPALDV